MNSTVGRLKLYRIFFLWTTIFALPLDKKLTAFLGLVYILHNELSGYTAKIPRLLSELYSYNQTIMKRRKILHTTLIAALLATFLGFNSARSPVLERNDGIPLCGSGSDDRVNRMENGKFMVPLPGWGSYSYKISTANDSAQFYFNQGLIMYYSYHMKEAMASFKEAARLDPTCPMAFWGQALAGGPFYNAAHLYTVPPGMSEVLARMNELAGNANPKKKG